MNFKNILNKNQVIKSGSHFVYTSGLHGDTYINKQIIFENDCLLKSILFSMKNLVGDKKVDYFVGPEFGGAFLAEKISTMFFYTNFLIARKSGLGFKIDSQNNLNNSKIVIVEDIVNTGGSVKEVIRSLKSKGAIELELLQL